ncbi:MAG TPA: hypothetical protein VGC42_23435, partial [Kofleriaceae bacterium]
MSKLKNLFWSAPEAAAGDEAAEVAAEASDEPSDEELEAVIQAPAQAPVRRSTPAPRGPDTAPPAIDF